MLAHKTFYKIGQPSMNFVNTVVNVASLGPATTKTLIDSKFMLSYAQILYAPLADKSTLVYIYVFIVLSFI